ncbi:MAG: ABC transporter ATP-binding protein [bacterium]
MIKINNLIHKYNKEEVLNIDNLEIPNNTITALCGINGCGKSTLLRILAGIFESNVLYNDELIYENPNAKKDILFISDDPLSKITINEIKKFYYLMYNMDITKFETYLELFEINKCGSLATFSKGMRRRVYLCVALSVSPKVLLLDEAFDGLDLIAKQIFKKEIIKQIDDKDMIVIISSHALKDIEDLSDNILFIKNGKITTENKLTKLSVCFNEEYNINDFKHKDIVGIEGNKKIFKIIISNKEVIDYFKEFNPIVLEIDELTYEEQFIYQNKEDTK